MEYIVVCIVALLASCLTFFSGFGLGTILMPIMALFFPLDIAIAMTAIVHFLNNIFKVTIVGKHYNKHLLFSFGLPAFLFSFAGAYCLTQLSTSTPLFTYAIGVKEINIFQLKFIIGCLMIVFALFDLLPSINKIQIDKKYSFFGGMLSGFFGGFSGNQGAFRSMFLIKSGVSKEEFVATGIVIALLVDTSRLLIYGINFGEDSTSFNWPLVGLATLSAFAGAYFGNKFLKKITVKNIQYAVGAMLIFIGGLMIAGLI